MSGTVHEYLNIGICWILHQNRQVLDKCSENEVHTVIWVPCKWMWRSWFPGEIRLARTAIGMLICTQKSFTKWIQAISYFNKKCTSCLLVPVAVRSGAQDLAAGCWDRRFQSRFGLSRHWLSWNDTPEKASLCPTSCSVRLPSRIPAFARLRSAGNLNLRGRKFAALNTAFLLSR